VDLIQAIILGLVQGLTEFLPISSSGHLFLVPEVMGWKDAGAGFTAVIQIGTLLAVLLYFRKDLSQTLSVWIRSFSDQELRRQSEARLAWAIVLGTIPIIVAGLAFQDAIETTFRNPFVVAGALIFFALVLALAERVGKQTRTAEDFQPKDGLIMGLWQALALVPGSSRSGCTITGGLFSNFDRAAAARASFLLSIPAITLSGVYKLIQERDVLLADGATTTIVATLVAFLSGYWAIAFLMKFLQTRSTMVFVIYRLVLGAIIIALALQGYFAHDPAPVAVSSHVVL